jgi:hypothetical protein
VFTIYATNLIYKVGDLRDWWFEAMIQRNTLKVDMLQFQQRQTLMILKQDTLPILAAI